MLVGSVLSPQVQPEHQREVLRRDLRARVRASRTNAARVHAMARRESMGVDTRSSFHLGSRDKLNSRTNLAALEPPTPPAGKSAAEALLHVAKKLVEPAW